MAVKIDYAAASSSQIIADIGQRIENIRLARNQTQVQIAKVAGVATRTIIRLEQGMAPTLETLVRVMRALDLTSYLEALLPDPDIRPVDRVRLGGRERLRARPDRTPRPAKPFQWGDESIEK